MLIAQGIKCGSGHWAISDQLEPKDRKKDGSITTKFLPALQNFYHAPIIYLLEWAGLSGREEKGVGGC